MRLAPSAPFTLGSVDIGDGWGGTLDTISTMRRLAREGSRSAQVRGTAARVVHLQPAKDELHEVNAVFEYVRDHIRYTRDPVYFESIATPDQVLSLGYGDCDDKSTLLAAMLESVGYATRFIVAGYRQAGVPEHVYLQALVYGEWVNADPTEHKPFGYAPPNPVFYWAERV